MFSEGFLPIVLPLVPRPIVTVHGLPGAVWQGGGERPMMSKLRYALEF